MQAFCEEHLADSEKGWYEKNLKKFQKSIDKGSMMWYTLWAVWKNGSELDLEN